MTSAAVSTGSAAEAGKNMPAILLVDDDRSILDSLARILRKEFPLLTASSGQEALATLAANPIGVIVVDMSMPVMNGLELLEAMRPRHADVVPIMLTGRLDQQTASDAINKGHVFRFLAKPCQADQLKGAIGDALLQHRLHAAQRELRVKTETLEAAFAAMHDGVCIADADASITSINGRAVQLLGIGEDVGSGCLPDEIVSGGEEIREVSFNEHLLQVSATSLSTGGRLFVLHDVTAMRQLEQQLRHEATTDPLTQLANRRRFLDVAAEEQARAQRYNRPLSILMLDVDFFKKVNDQYGHAAGDDVLRRVGAVLAEGVRATDVAGRFGGEEFIVLLSESDVAETRMIGERLRTALAAQSIDTPSGPISVTASLGAATATGIDIDIKRLISDADGALYVAKRGGRNRLVYAGESTVEHTLGTA